MTLPCIRCDKELKSAIPSHVRENRPDWQPENQPSAGTSFTTYGHYGSTVFDPEGHAVIGREFLEINVCDECMIRAGRAGNVLHGTAVPRPAATMRPWDCFRLEWCEHCGAAVPLPHDLHYDEVPF